MIAGRIEGAALAGALSGVTIDTGLDPQSILCAVGGAGNSFSRTLSAGASGGSGNLTADAKIDIDEADIDIIAVFEGRCRYGEQNTTSTSPTWYSGSGVYPLYGDDRGAKYYEYAIRKLAGSAYTVTHPEDGVTRVAYSSKIPYSWSSNTGSSTQYYRVKGSAVLVVLYRKAEA